MSQGPRFGPYKLASPAREYTKSAEFPVGQTYVKRPLDNCYLKSKNLEVFTLISKL
jgi:hypothetical protein